MSPTQIRMSLNKYLNISYLKRKTFCSTVVDYNDNSVCPKKDCDRLYEQEKRNQLSFLEGHYDHYKLFRPYDRFGLMTDSAVVDSALVDAALRKSGLISN
jgi:hypothetical protein